MREIKFRAWDKEKKEMFEHGLFYLSTQKDFVEGFLCQINDGEWVDYKGKLTLMQYTGLKDKNGKEIYEGDIVNNYEYNYEVIFFNGSFGLEISKDELKSPLCFYNNIEVIGNIYENPELLKEE